LTGRASSNGLAQRIRIREGLLGGKQKGFPAEEGGSGERRGPGRILCRIERKTKVRSFPEKKKKKIRSAKKKGENRGNRGAVLAPVKRGARRREGV